MKCTYCGKDCLAHATATYVVVAGLPFCCANHSVEYIQKAHQAYQDYESYQPTIDGTNRQFIKLLEGMFRAVNSMACEKDMIDATIQVLHKQHRTLQENFFQRVIAPMLVALSYDYAQGNYDARNQLICEIASEFINTTEHGDNMKYIVDMVCKANATGKETT